jgi:3-oxoacyl-[acyl-carrier protein] reductase
MIKLGKYHYLSNGGLRAYIGDYLNIPDAHFRRRGNALEGKTALITGGSRGIGLSIVKTFVREGARVIFTGRGSGTLKEEQKKSGDQNAAFFEWDISDTRICGTMMSKAFDIFGTIDILVNNAGVNKINGKIQDFLEISEDHLRAIHQVNAIGTFRMCENYAEVLNGKKGRIINILSSTSFNVPFAPYQLSKWAALSYTRALAARLKPLINVNGIAPGPVMTDMMQEKGRIFIPWLPSKRLALPEEIAELTLMLAGKTGDLFYGQIFSCDGGETLR